MGCPQWFLLVTAGLVAALAVSLQYATSVTYPVHTEGYIVLSGASTGIGRDAAFALAAIGYTVLAGVRNDRSAASLEEEADRRHVASLVVPVLLDVTKQEQVAAIKNRVVSLQNQTNLPLVAVINNAGIADNNPVEMLSMEQVEKVFAVNVFGVFRLTIEFVPLLRASKGRVVSIGSMAGVMAGAGYQPYSATKFAMESFSDSLRRELVPFGVSVTLIDPACVRSAIFDAFVGSQDLTLTAEQESSPYRDLLLKYKRDGLICRDTAEDAADTTSVKIVEAITSPQPASRYVTSSFNGVPAQVVRFIAKLPDRWVDALAASDM
eukprot:m.467531 g.467531  ORF g.467531 m.467531 type:complete len:322 (-) comp20364_c1_seq3:69-1034(-)